MAVTSRNTEKGTLGIDDAVAEAEHMFYKVKQYYKSNSNTNEESVRYLHKLLVEEHKDFSGSYPLVVRTMVYESFFNAKVLKNFLVHVSHNPWRSREEFLERQVEYLVYVIRHKNPRMDQKKLYDIRNNMRKQILEEDKAFEKTAKEVMSKLDEEHQSAKDDRRQKILELLQKLQEDSEASKASESNSSALDAPAQNVSDESKDDTNGNH